MRLNLSIEVIDPSSKSKLIIHIRDNANSGTQRSRAVIYLGDESIHFNSANLHDRINLNKSLHDNEERVEITGLNFAFGNPPLSPRERDIS